MSSELCSVVQCNKNAIKNKNENIIGDDDDNLFCRCEPLYLQGCMGRGDSGRSYDVNIFPKETIFYAIPTVK